MFSPSALSSSLGESDVLGSDSGTVEVDMAATQQWEWM